MHKNLRLLYLILISSAVVAVTGAWLKYSIYLSDGLYQNESIMALPFVLLTDQSVPGVWEPVLPEENTTEPTETDPIPETTSATENTEVPETTIPETTIPEETVPVAVDESWFDDALFIGDSRTVGLSRFGRLGNADYFCDVGLTVYGLLGRGLSDAHFYAMDIGTLLRSREYGKIYINLGLNGLNGDWDIMLGKYQEDLDFIRELQPNAVIILEGLMAIGREKASREPYYMPESIAAFNERLQEMAVGDKMRYIDVNEWIADEEGYLPDSFSEDGCHPYADKFEEWAAWLLENAGTLGIP